MKSLLAPAALSAMLLLGIAAGGAGAAGDRTALLELTAGFAPDVTAPTLTPVRPQADAWVKGRVPVRVAVTDLGGSGVASVSYSFCGVQRTTVLSAPYSGIVDTGKVSGRKPIDIVAADKAGNRTRCRIPVWVDNAAPRIVPATRRMLWKRGGNIRFKTIDFHSSPAVPVLASARISLGGRVVRVLPVKRLGATRRGSPGYLAWDGKDSRGRYCRKGTYTVSVTLKDAAGNRGGGTFRLGLLLSPTVLPLDLALLRPLPGPVISAYGWRMHPIYGYRKFHKGLDIGGPHSQVIRAAAPGRVTYTGSQGGWGRIIMLDNGKGVATYYAHCSAFIARPGQLVRAGQPIARVGSTGNARTPHLHFEVHVGKDTRDPLVCL